MPAEQARGIGEVVEEAATAVQLDLKDFIRSEFDKHFSRIEAKIDGLRSEINGRVEALRAESGLNAAQTDTRMEGLRAEMHKAIQEQTQRYIFILIGLLSLAVTVIKLFPNLQ